MSKDRNDAIDVKFTLGGMVCGVHVVDIYWEQSHVEQN